MSETVEASVENTQQPVDNSPSDTEAASFESTDTAGGAVPDQLEPQEQQPLTEAEQKDVALQRLVDLKAVTTDVNGDISPITKDAFLNMSVEELQEKVAQAEDIYARQELIDEFVAEGLLDPTDENFEQHKLQMLAMSPGELRGLLLVSQIEENALIREAIATGDVDAILNAFITADQEVHATTTSPEESRLKAEEIMLGLQSFVLSYGAEALRWWGDRFGETWDRGFQELIDALVQGADYGKIGGSGEYGAKRAEGGENAVTKDLFILEIKNNPAKFSEKLLKAYDSAEGLRESWHLGPDGEQILSEASQANTKEEAMRLLRTVITGSSSNQENEQTVTISNSLLHYLFVENPTETEQAQRWKKVSATVGKEAFGKPLGDDVRTLLVEIKKTPSLADTLFV